MTRSTSLFPLALAVLLGAATAAQAQDTARKAPLPAAKSAAAAKAGAKALPMSAAKDAPQGSAAKALVPVSVQPASSRKDGYSGCHSKDSDA